MVGALLLSGCAASAPGAPPAASAERESCERERADLERRLAAAEQRIEELETAPPASVAPEAVPDETGTIRLKLERAAFDALFQDQQQLMRSGRAVPVTENGRMTGIRLFGIRAGSPLAELGYQNGDIVRRLNDHELVSMEKALEAYDSARRARELRVDMIRRGKPLRVVIEITEPSDA